MSETSVFEVVEGIVRIESVLGPRPFAQYLLRDERTLLVDTGVKTTPADVILPALDGLQPDYVLISHADVDHHGGNEAIKQAAPKTVLCAHEADAPWIENRDRIMVERYGWYAHHGIGYPPDAEQWLRDQLGEDTPLDLQVQGGEVLRLGPNLSVLILHLPGHSPGHLGIWEPVSRTAIVADAVMGRGLLDCEGNVIHPPPYFDAATYEASARMLKSLEPDVILTSHYPVMEGERARRFLDDTLDFVADARRVVAEQLAETGELALDDLLGRANPALGPFTSMPNELAGPLRAHLQELVDAGRAVETPDGRHWTEIARERTYYDRMT